MPVSPGRTICLLPADWLTVAAEHSSVVGMFILFWPCSHCKPLLWQANPGSPRMQATGSLDAVVAFDGLASVGDQAPQYFAEVARVLKPGAPFIFFDRRERSGVRSCWRSRGCVRVFQLMAVCACL